MRAIKDPTQVHYYGKLIGEMMRAESGAECDFDDEWIRRRSWTVVPVESAMRLPAEDISRFVSVFRQAGHKNCIAVFNEAGYLSRLPVLVESDPPGDLATCYIVDIDETDFRELNRQLGPFRFVMTDENRSWAISCNESYNLFAGEPAFVISLLGKTIETARKEFLEFASVLGQSNPDEPLMRVAKHYAAL